GRSPRAAGHLPCRLGGRGGTQPECRSLHHLRELLLPVRLEPFLMPKTSPKRLRDRPQTGRCPHEGEGLKAHSNHPGLASLPEDRIHNAILEGRVEVLLRGFLKPMDLIQEEEPSSPDAREEGDELVGISDVPRDDLNELRAALSGKEPGERRLAQPG